MTNTPTTGDAMTQDQVYTSLCQSTLECVTIEEAQDVLDVLLAAAEHEGLEVNLSYEALVELARILRGK